MVFFVCLGGVTNWLDFLTYPLAALGIPLLMLMTLRNEGEGSFNCKDTIKAVLCWGAGYSGMWILKWCLATIIMHRNIFENAINQARFRTSQTVYDVRHSRTEVIITNMREMFKRPYFVALLVSVLYCVRMALPLIRSKVYRTLPYFFVFMMPFAWYMVMFNHSWIHYWFTYRTLCISVLAHQFWLLQLRGPVEKSHFQL